MRFIACCSALLLCLLLVPVALTQDERGIIERANASYDAGLYETAATLYETVVAAGVRDNNVYFNLGTAYYMQGNLGRALLNYRHAQVLMPRDIELSEQIARLRVERADLQSEDSDYLVRLHNLTADALTTIELSWLTAILWAGWFIGLAVYVLRPVTRDWLRAVLSVGGVLLFTALGLLGSRVYIETVRPAVVVVQPAVVVMSGPGDGYLEHFTLYNAAELRLVESRDTWARVVLPDGRQGWIPSASFERVN